MCILNQNLLTLDSWQDKVTYGKRTVPIGTIGCAALNITDEQITELSTLCQPLSDIVLMLGAGNIDVSVFPMAEESLLKIIQFLQKAKPFYFWTWQRTKMNCTGFSMKNIQKTSLRTSKHYRKSAQQFLLMINTVTLSVS